MSMGEGSVLIASPLRLPSSLLLILRWRRSQSVEGEEGRDEMGVK